MFNVDLLSSVPTKSDKGCSKHGESYPCSYMPCSYNLSGCMNIGDSFIYELT